MERQQLVETATLQQQLCRGMYVSCWVYPCGAVLPLWGKEGRQPSPPKSTNERVVLCCLVCCVMGPLSAPAPLPPHTDA